MIKKMNVKNITMGVYALLLGYVFSVALHNILNLEGYTQITPLFTDGGFVGISMFFVLWTLTLFYIKNNVSCVRLGIVIAMGVSCANVAVNGDFIVLLLSLALIMAFCGYQIKEQCNILDIIILFLTVFLTMNIFGTAMIMSEIEFDGRIDMVLQSMWMDLITVLMIMCVIYRQKVCKWFENTILRRGFIVASILVSVLLVVTSIIFLAFTEFQVLVSAKVIISFIVLSIIFFIGSAIYIKTVGEINRLELEKYDVFVLLTVTVIVICSLYLMNISLQDGAIFDAYGSQNYAEWAKKFHLSSPAIIYRIIVCFNTGMMIGQFFAIRQIVKDVLYIIEDRRFFAGMKDCKQILTEKEREFSAIILALICVCVPDCLILSEKAENVMLFFIVLNIWIALFCLFRLLMSKNINYMYGLLVECLFLVWQYFSSRAEQLAFPNISLQVVVLIAGIILFFFAEASGKTVWIAEVLLATLFVCVSASSASELMKTQIRYDEIEDEITCALKYAKGNVYYDDSISSTLQFVLNDHMLIDKQKGSSSIDDLLLSVPEGKLPDAIDDYLDVDADGYRILDMNSDWMPYVMAKGEYRFVGIVEEQNALLSRNKNICEKLDATDMPTKNIKMLDLDDIKIDLWGFDTRYVGYEDDEIPDEDAEVEAYLFLISVVDKMDTQNVYYNVNKFELGYHIYQNNKEILYDGVIKELEAFVSADGVYEFELNPDIFESDEFAEFDPEQDYDLVLDVVNPGIEWLSWDHGTKTLTLHHTKDDMWKVETR